MMKIEINETKNISLEAIIELYRENEWSSADKPKLLHNALINSHSLVSAWDGEKLVGIANAISDGFLVVYFPHLLVLPNYQRKGIGKKIMDIMLLKYKNFHQQMLTADRNAIKFYSECGFERAGNTESMWIYSGSEH